MDTMVKSKKKKKSAEDIEAQVIAGEQQGIPDWSHLPQPSMLPKKFQNAIKISSRPDVTVVMNYYSGAMSVSRNQNVANHEKGTKETYNGEMIDAPGAWFRLNEEERKILFPLFVNWLFFDWVAINSQATYNQMSSILKELGDTPKEIQDMDDLRFVTDVDARKVYEEIINARNNAAESGAEAKEARAAADQYKRPSFISPADAFSLDYYAKQDLGYLEQYSRYRESKRREEEMIRREEQITRDEITKERARNRARKQVESEEA